MVEKNLTRTHTPIPCFDPETGYLYLTDGQRNQVLLRFEWPHVYVLWRRGEKTEVPLHIGELFRLLAPE